MKAGNRAFAILAGVFLILYALPDIIFSSRGDWMPPWKIYDLYTFSAVILVPLSGVLLCFRRSKAAAILMSAAALISVLLFSPELMEFIENGQYRATYDATINYAEYLPMRFVVLPVFYMAAPILFAVMLYTRGKISLVLAFLIAVVESVATVFQIASSAYVTGHPSIFNLVLPFNYSSAAIFTGLFLLTEKTLSTEKKER